MLNIMSILKIVPLLIWVPSVENVCHLYLNALKNENSSFFIIKIKNAVSKPSCELCESHKRL